MIARLFFTVIVFVCFSSVAHAGIIEICKDSTPPGSVSGLFSFTIAGQTGTFLAPVGACTPAITLPNGTATITELPQAGAMFSSANTFPTNRLISFDPTMASAMVQVVAGDISTQTVVTFVNTPKIINVGIPEPATGWLLGLGLTLWALRRNLTTRPS